MRYDDLAAAVFDTSTPSKGGHVRQAHAPLGSERVLYALSVPFSSWLTSSPDLMMVAPRDVETPSSASRGSRGRLAFFFHPRAAQRPSVDVVTWAHQGQRASRLAFAHREPGRQPGHLDQPAPRSWSASATRCSFRWVASKPRVSRVRRLRGGDRGDRRALQASRLTRRTARRHGERRDPDARSTKTR